MKIYEVIFWGAHGDGNAEDTIYLVRAPDFRAALDDVQRNGDRDIHNANVLADVVYEVGIDLSPYADANPCILRGPYFATAFNAGWKSWKRKREETDRPIEWEEN